jgi:hemolysin E
MSHRLPSWFSSTSSRSPPATLRDRLAPIIPAQKDAPTDAVTDMLATNACYYCNHYILNPKEREETMTDPQAVITTVKDGLEAGEKALDLYNKVLDQVIPWKTFEETIKELTKYEKDYSTKAGQLVGKTKTLLLNSRDEYLKATQSVYEWCAVASKLLEAYLTLFTNYDKDKARAQKNILLKVLGDGVTKMTAAQESLHTSSTSFNEAAGFLSALRTQLQNDFSEGSSYYEQQVDKLRKEAYGGAAAGLVAGPFGLVISYSIAAGVVEGKLIPEMKAKFEEVKAFFEHIQQIVSQTDKDITDAKVKLAEEIRVIGDVKTDTETTELYVEYDDLMLNLLKKSARDLIDKCQMYMDRHRTR